jgi:hypothetical protein
VLCAGQASVWWWARRRAAAMYFTAPEGSETGRAASWRTTWRTMSQTQRQEVTGVAALPRVARQILLGVSLRVALTGSTGHAGAHPGVLVGKGPTTPARPDPVGPLAARPQAPVPARDRRPRRVKGATRPPLGRAIARKKRLTTCRHVGLRQRLHCRTLQGASPTHRPGGKQGGRGGGAGFRDLQRFSAALSARQCRLSRASPPA